MLLPILGYTEALMFPESSRVVVTWMLVLVVQRGAEGEAAMASNSVHIPWHLLRNGDSISHVNQTDIILPLPLPALKAAKDKMRGWNPGVRSRD